MSSLDLKRDSATYRDFKHHHGLCHTDSAAQHVSFPPRCATQYGGTQIRIHIEMSRQPILLIQISHIDVVPLIFTNRTRVVLTDGWRLCVVYAMCADGDDDFGLVIELICSNEVKTIDQKHSQKCQQKHIETHTWNKYIALLRFWVFG